MVLCGVLDNGEAKTSAANLLGVALIDAVEALKHAALVSVGNADAGIHDGKRGRRSILPDRNSDIAARNVILDRVVAEVLDHFL